MYKLNFLPVAKRDMVEIVQYIAQKLSNPQAAEQLAAAMIDTAEGLCTFPYANPAYLPVKPLTHSYRKVTVQNYLMFYWIDEAEKIVTVARVVYARRNYGEMLK